MKAGIAIDNNSGDLKTDGLVPSLFKDWMKIPFEQSIKNAPGIKSKLKQSEIKTEGKVPVVDQGESFIAGYTDDENNTYKAELPLIVFGDHTRHIKYVDFPFAVGADGTKIIIPQNYFLTRFFYQYLNTLNWQHEGYGRNYKFLKQIIVPLPPLNEQKRIVAKLDAIMPRIEAVKARLDKVPGVLKRFRQSVLTAAVTGKLTGSEGYTISAFGDLIVSIRGGTTTPPRKELSDYPVLRSSSVRQGFIDYNDVFYLTKDQSTRQANFIKNGDVLFTRLNGSVEFVGNCAVVKGVRDNYIQYPDRLYCAKLTADILPEYCEIAFADPFLRLEIENRAKSSAGHKRISISDVKEMAIPLPPLEEQKEIVRQVDKLFALADKVEAHYQKAKARVDKLSQSVLAKAFRGELVPQDPNDEPAEKLLERILEEKAKMEAEHKGTRKRGSKK